MQKLLKRTVQAEKQVARRKAKRNDIKARAEAQREFRKRMTSVTDANQALLAARRRRREDWELGPLAPRRDTPIKDVNGAYWGSMSLNRSTTELGERQRELACKWAGGFKYLCLKAGDRVAIMQGPDKGKIGTVRSILEDESMVVMDGDHLEQNVTISDFLAEAGLVEERTFTQLSPLRVPIQAVRLVHPLRDQDSGKVRDVIINELKPINIFRDKPTKRVTWQRVVPGLNVEIPWPRAFEEAERNALEQVFDDNECDTLRIDVEERTFVPSLLTPPMPAEIVDELRNKYSKFRTRHEPEYIARKEEEAATRIAISKQLRTMQTPQQELNDAIRAEKKALGQPVLSDAMLERIGEFIFRAQQAKNAGKEQDKSGEVETPGDDVNGAEQSAAERAEQLAAKRAEAIELRLRYMSKKNRAKEEAYLRKKGQLPRLGGPPTPDPAPVAPPAVPSQSASAPPSS
ncbi:unnamed protein product [Discula destructiva]